MVKEGTNCSFHAFADEGRLLWNGAGPILPELRFLQVELKKVHVFFSNTRQCTTCKGARN